MFIHYTYTFGHTATSTINIYIKNVNDEATALGHVQCICEVDKWIVEFKINFEFIMSGVHAGMRPYFNINK